MMMPWQQMYVVNDDDYALAAGVCRKCEPA